MSSKIYFSSKSGKSPLWYIINNLVKVAHFIFPNATEKQIRKVLLKPHNRPPKPIPNGIKKSSINTEYGDLAVYKSGDKNQPAILFTHGWSGASSQFYELMQMVAEQGYYCIAFDHYAHHHSTGKECNFPLFVLGLQKLVRELELEKNLRCIVSHSMGVAGTVNVFHGKNIPHFFIAPFFNFWHELSSRITGAGIPDKLFRKIIASIEIDYGIQIKDLEPDLHMPKINAPIHIVHDPQDKFAAYKFSQKYHTQQSNITLQTIESAGHMRIVNDKTTQSALQQFLKNT